MSNAVIAVLSHKLCFVSSAKQTNQKKPSVKVDLDVKLDDDDYELYIVLCIFEDT